MLHFLNNLLKNKILLSVLAFWGCCQLSFGQFITGPSTVGTNSTHWYSYQDGNTYSFLQWVVVGATNLSAAIQSGDVFNAEIQFPETTGSATITVKNGRILLTSYNVIIEEAAPPPSPPPLPPPTIISDENSIHTITPRLPVTDILTLGIDDKIEAVTYYDGLGRPIQNINIRGGGIAEDIITHIEYDEFGRQIKDYLPYAELSDGGLYRSDALSPTKSYYKTNYPDDFTGVLETNINPYSEKDLESSPLNRILKQAAPGDDWKLNNGNEIEFSYLTNTGTEVKNFSVELSLSNNTYMPTLTGGTTFYATGELYKTITKDENHSGASKNHTTEEYKNKLGQVLLKRTYADISSVSTAHDTYYIYDDHGNLTYVLPPKMNATTEILANINGALNDLAYQYVYDNKDRLVEKKIPGKGWEYIIYNKLNQPVLTQDANLDADNKWLFTKYDAFGRVAYTGKMSSNSSRITLQTSVDNTSVQYETRSGSSTTIDDKTVYYNNVAYPTVNMSELHTVNYYDSNEDLPGGVNSTVTTSYGLTSSTKTKGLPTVSKVRVLDTSHWITTVNYYDDKGRSIYVYSTNPYLGTTDTVESELDFTGQPEKVITTHTKGGNTITTTEVFTYDHVGRLIKQTHKINNGSEEVIVLNDYDDLGQLKTKNVGNTDSTPLQTVDYTYNVRGWLKDINDVNSLGTDLFGFRIKYNNPDLGTALYNGNISQTIWKTANTDSSTKAYTYSYDALNRIKSGIDYTGKYNLVNVDYDKNGNITELFRKGHIVANPDIDTPSHFGDMDNLTYTYDSGNKLITVDDNLASDIYGFKDGVDIAIEYTYDDNGNMLSDANKNIQLILYNFLNLPISIYGGTGDDEGISTYIYDATGNKLSKIVNNAQSATTTTTDYAGNYIYEDGSLKFFNHPEGYVEPKDANNYGLGFDYVYQYKDHLGNIRLSYKDTNGDGSITASTEIQEENNYYPFGLKHKGYNNVVNGTENNYQTFQGQEINKELDLNWLSFKYRNYDPAIGRFMSIDPLAEDYVHNSTYAFAENKVISHLELEGLEGVHSSKVNGAGIRTHVVQKNVIVLTQAPRPVSEGANPRKAARIQRQNARIEKSNIAKVNNVKSELKNFYSGAKNSAGESVDFQFNVTAMEVENTDAQPGREMTQIALDNGIESSTVLFDGGAEQTAPAAIISTAGAGGSHGVTDGVVVKTNSGAPDGAKSHEIGHTLKLKDNYSGSGVMASPPNRVNSTEVDEIIKKSYTKKDE